MADSVNTLIRHRLGARVVHAVVAIVAGALIVSGLGSAANLPEPLLKLLGGHSEIAWFHYWLGHGFSFAALILAFAVPGNLLQLVSSLLHMHRAEVKWFFDFLRMCRNPRLAAPWHNGRFDPMQRIDLLLIGGALALLAMSGLALDVIPNESRRAIGWAIRIHVAAAAVLIGSVCLHGLVGSGLLPSHRGVGRTMFGDGRVEISLARRLWPGWSLRQSGRESGRDSFPGSEALPVTQIVAPPAAEPHGDTSRKNSQP